MSFRYFTCTLSASMYQDVVYDENLGRYVEVEDGKLNDSSSGDENILKARLCPCVWHPELPNFYCIKGTGEQCRVARDAVSMHFRGENPVTCLTGSSSQEFIRSLWPIIPLSFGALLLSLFVTRQGRNAVKYIMSFCCPGVNNSLVARVYRREMLWLERARQAVHQQVIGMEDSENGQLPSSFVLKTETFDTQKMIARRDEKRKNAHSERLEEINAGETFYTCNISDDCDVDNQRSEISAEFTAPRQKDELSTHQETTTDITPLYEQASSNPGGDDESIDNVVTCTICLLDLEDGDRIAVLPCDHYFHADCLKPWIQKKNACPLCQKSNIAEPQWENENQNDNGNGIIQPGESDDNSDEVQGGSLSLTSRIRARLSGRTDPNTARVIEDENVLHANSITTQEAIIHRRLRNASRYTENNRFMGWFGTH
mmetsp:Transcript_22921/g.33286  ORF Transcript_22921/g.33286 Transcript_22921/m.33286 type:complete len:428 (-) Transcript_22921:273-1556(-)